MLDSYLTDREKQIEREAELYTNTEWLSSICDHIAHGGSLIELCHSLGVSHVRILKKIQEDKELRSKYNDAILSRDETTKERILNDLRSISYFNVSKLFDESGVMIHPSQWPKDASIAVLSIDIQDIYSKNEKLGEVVKVRFHDKLKSIELLGKQMSMFAQKVEHSGKLTIEDNIYAAQKIIEAESKVVIPDENVTEEAI